MKKLMQAARGLEEFVAPCRTELPGSRKLLDASGEEIVKRCGRRHLRWNVACVACSLRSGLVLGRREPVVAPIPIPRRPRPTVPFR